MTITDLIKLAEKLTPGDLSTAATHDAVEEVDCPFCDGQGSVDGETYTNFDDVAMGVQFFGVGDEHAHWQAYFNALKPSRLMALLKVAEAARTCQKFFPVETNESEEAAFDKLDEALAALNKELADG